MRYCQNCSQPYDDHVMYCPQCTSPTMMNYVPHDPTEEAAGKERCIFWIPGLILSILAGLFALVALLSLPITLPLVSVSLFLVILAVMFFTLSHSPDTSSTVTFREKIFPKKRFIRFAMIAAWLELSFLLPILTYVVRPTDEAGLSATTVREDKEAGLLADMTQFSGLTADELTAVLGKPSTQMDTTYFGVHDFAAEHFRYASVGGLQDVTFVLLDKKVALAYSYNSVLPRCETDEEQLALFGISLPVHLARGYSNDQLFYNFPSEKVDKVIFRNFDADSQTFAVCQIHYDLYYSKDWYLPLTDEEIAYYVPLSKQIITEVLAEQGILSIQFSSAQTYWAKNLLHLFVLTDILDEEGELLYERACCIYEIATGELIGLSTKYTHFDRDGLYPGVILHS